jgi:uncharacterized repeat protein (TIGR02543 family)
MHTLTFVTDGSAVAPITAVEGTVINLSAYTSAKNGYTFDGWFIGEEEVTTIALDADKTVTAKFTEIVVVPTTYTLTFVTDGSTVAPITAEEGTVIDLSAYTSAKDGYTFDGWFIGEEEVNEITLDADKTVTAKFTQIPVTPAGVTVSGNITSYLVADGTVTVELISGGSVAYTTTGTTSFTFEGVAAGTYTLTVAKANHATREYEITVADAAVTQNVKIQPKGDATGDGNITTMDSMRANAHAKGANRITDAYILKCIDVVGTDGNITTMDVMKINAHAKGSSPLWSVPANN